MILYPSVSLAEASGLAESLRYQAVGFAIVLVVLAVIWLLVRMVGMGFTRVARPAAPDVAASSSPPTDPSNPPPALSPEIVAVIAAAVHCAFHAPHRIVSITETHPGHPSLNIQAWSVEGRRQIFSSHSVR